jgi:hypothetical protein
VQKHHLLNILELLVFVSRPQVSVNVKEQNDLGWGGGGGFILKNNLLS